MTIGQSTDSYRNVNRYLGQDYRYAPSYIRSRDPKNGTDGTPFTSPDIRPKEQQGYYPIGSFWINTTLNRIWVLTEFGLDANHLTCGHWELLESSGITGTEQFDLPDSSTITPIGTPPTVTFQNGAGITITQGTDSHSINIAVTGGGVAIETINGNSGSVTGSTITIATANTTVKFVGSGSTLTEDFGLSNLLEGSSGSSITTAVNNCGYGLNALTTITTGQENVATGVNCLNHITTGSKNCGYGTATLSTLTTSANNSCFGENAGNLISTGTGGNTSIGYQSLNQLTTGAFNTCVGYQAGNGYTSTEQNNILIGNGVLGTAAESNVTRIGNGSISKFFATGIDGVNLSTAKVVTESSNQLGTATITGGTGINIDTSTANTIKVSLGGAIGPAFQQVTRQVFTSSGTYTPTANMLYCDIEVLGGGGGGGGVVGNNALINACGGGASGGYARGIFSASTIGVSQTVTIGAGGAGNSGATGGNGGTTSVGALISAQGGGPGLVSVPVGGGVSEAGQTRTGTGGDFQTYGTPGSIGFISGSTNQAIGGNGGSSFFGGGGWGDFANTGNTTAGHAANSYGAGGSGACSQLSATSAAGGAGAPGIVIITEYLG